MTMMPFNRMRLLHWLVASLCLLAYLTGDDGELWHIWLGYGLIVALIVVGIMASLNALAGTVVDMWNMISQQYLAVS